MWDISLVLDRWLLKFQTVGECANGFNAMSCGYKALTFNRCKWHGYIFIFFLLSFFILEFLPQAFGMTLSQVIANDRAHKLKQDSHKDEQKEVSDFVTSILPFGSRRQNKELSSSNSSLSSTSETPNESTSPNTPEAAPRARRRVSSRCHA